MTDSQPARGLKACPFCLCDRATVKRRDWGRTIGVGYEATCPSCDSSASIHDDPDSAAKAWNTRVEPVGRGGGEWVACSERMPEHGQPVHFVRRGIVYDGERMDKEPSFPSFRSQRSTYYDHNVGDVTHWMPRYMPKGPVVAALGAAP